MTFKTLAVLLAGLALPAAAAAQAPLRAGTWTGNVTPVDASESVPLTFDVTVRGDSLVIVIHVGEHGDFTSTDGRYADGKLTFSFSPPGATINCTLTRKDDDSLIGPCLGPDGDDAVMVMVPPGE